MAIPYYNDTVCLQRVIYICTEWRDAAFIKLGKLYNDLKSATIIQYTIKGRFMSR